MANFRIKNIIPRWQIERLTQMLDRATRVVVTCHLSPDGDAIGSSLAMCALLRRMGKTADVVLPDQLPHTLQFIAQEEVIPTVYTINRLRATGLVERADIVFCLDYNALKRIDKLAEIIEPCRAPLVLIDHHEDPDTSLFRLWLSYPEMSSTCELVYRLIVQAGWHALLDRFIGRSLYLGIMTDTGNFTHNNSNNPELYEIVADLLRYDIDKSELYERAMNTFTVNSLRLQGYALAEKLEIFPDHGVALMTLSRDELERYDYHKGDTEGLVNRPLTIPGVSWVVFMREDANYIKVSMRSKEGFSVSEICTKYFNGGGHELAAGGDFYGSLEEAVAVFRRILADVGTVKGANPEESDDSDNDTIFDKLNIQ